MLRIAFLIFGCAALAMAQTPYASSIEPATNARQIAINRGSVALWQSLKKLHTRASLVMVTAHPDDEDGGMLTYESRGAGARVALLTLNRGEGGANVMSPDLFDALGLVRTQELLAAGNWYGVNQYWTRVVDYGFSKTLAESMKMWTHERVLSDVVRLIRTIRPLVITSVFVGGPSDGHGNHQTAGRMAQEAFKAAGDPNMFPEQLREGLQVWAPAKVYARVPFRMRADSSPDVAANVEIPTGEYDSVLGASYAQIAREGLGYQKSQNGGSSIPADGEMASPYHRYGSAVPTGDKESSFFEGIDISLLGIATLAPETGSEFLKRGLARINAAVEEAIAKFSASDPERTAPALAAGLRETTGLLAELEKSSLPAEAKYNVRHELEAKVAQFDNALSEALGLSIAASVAPEREPDPRFAAFMGDPDTFRMAIPGQALAVNVRVVNRSAGKVRLDKVYLEPSTAGHSWNISAPEETQVALADNQPVRRRFTLSVPEDAPLTKPFFARPDIEQSYYDVDDARHFGRPLAPYPLAAWAEATYEGVSIRVGEYVQTAQRVNGEGTVLEPLTIGPAVGVAISPRAGIVPLDSKAFNVSVVVHSNVKGPAEGSAKLELPAGWTSAPASAAFATTADGEDQTVNFAVTPANLAAKPYEIKAYAEYKGRRNDVGYEVTGYKGLRPYFLYRPATYRLAGVDVKTAPGLNVGYVMGSGDDVPTALEHLGIRVTTLGPADIASGDLSKFDVILLGIRAYAAREDIKIHNNRLLEYVHSGGVLIVQYNTPEYDHNYGPYPYVMGADPEEVTDEASKVNILDPSNPIFNWPNKITEGDFTGWVEERGSKWLQSWDPQYQALLETHDEDQAPQKGGLLYARYGKGVYIYNAYAFYRELPEGVPGAYRLFANMLSLAKNPNR